ncbi:hypothetical protein [Nocardiopsis tropica]|uniref:Uncharacterized protein n=1 Tax=Nocardiopsis tropica TaxID=109330 RepID=A0ABU7KNT5_9ACTN|nr:hypothetical protein [Nocardiopsis umidischolae]MEE2050337.1 hypothetical protein [Nocardiopsis umidischolae]
MGSRIITLQRQARELGRLRTGTFNGRYPQRSETWVITSHSRDYIEAAAETWGGDVEEWKPQGAGAKQWRVITEARAINAILPPGDPLSQAYESWSRGGCTRRCDGQVEQINDTACVCVATWGPDFHQVAPKDKACKMTTRLSVILPDMPDLGSWRVETHSYYSASELAATVDVLKGQLGQAAMVPVALRIEQRTRVANGETKHFPVVAMELRGATAGQVMAGQIPTAEVASPAGQAPAVGAGDAPAALPPAPGRDWVAEVRAAASLDDMRALYAEAGKAGAPDELAVAMRAAMKARADQLAEQSSDGRAARPAPEPETAPPAPASSADEAADTDAAWLACVSATPDGWSTTDLLDAFAVRYDGLLADDASAVQLNQYAKDLRAGLVVRAGQPERSGTPTLDALKDRAADQAPPPGDDTPPF